MDRPIGMLDGDSVLLIACVCCAAQGFEPGRAVVLPICSPDLFSQFVLVCPLACPLACPSVCFNEQLFGVFRRDHIITHK